MASNTGITITDHDHIEERHTFKMRHRASGVTRTECNLRTYLGVGTGQVFSELGIYMMWECVHRAMASRAKNRVVGSKNHVERTEE